ncbi:hypothetical protein [Methylobacterium sp. J-076]|nr:hypothetical protein [Methylobacterium sp. J-076]MCJ2013036.1 hypothetical protein [Methylobacterium sp. J-076]
MTILNSALPGLVVGALGASLAALLAAALLAARRTPQPRTVKVPARRR